MHVRGWLQTDAAMTLDHALEPIKPHATIKHVELIWLFAFA